MLDFVREQLNALPAGELPRLAVEADMTERTVRNVKAAKRGVQYDTVKRLYKILSEARAAEAAAAKA
jgi:hypothetical protein